MTKPKREPSQDGSNQHAEAVELDGNPFAVKESPRVSKPDSKEVDKPRGETQKIELEKKESGRNTERLKIATDPILCEDASSSVVLV